MLSPLPKFAVLGTGTIWLGDKPGSALLCSATLWGVQLLGVKGIGLTQCSQKAQLWWGWGERFVWGISVSLQGLWMDPRVISNVLDRIREGKAQPKHQQRLGVRE